jgi:uncharacterized membrane protein
MTTVEAERRPIAMPILLILTGALGWFAAFNLVLDKIALLKDPEAALSCNFSLLVQCGKNLDSWQGEVFFGVPNPIWGLGGFVAPIAVGVAILAGARFARWFWIAFAVGVTGALAFCIWLMSQSFFSLGTLCPWCMLVWAVTIPLFWTVWLHILSSGILPVPERARRVFQNLYTWVTAITVASYLIVALVAQLALDWIGYL